MPGFLQRLRHPRRHVSQADVAKTAEEKKKQREEFEDDYPDEIAPGRNRIPSLPSMQDNGPWSHTCYISQDLFWNSALTKAGDGARIQVRPDHSSSKRKSPFDTEHDRRRTALRKREEAISYQKDFDKFTQLQADAKRQHEYENRGLGRIIRAKIVRGKERADNDRTIMSYYIPVSPRPPSVPIVPSKRPLGPLRHSTKEWDDFMGFEPNEHGIPYPTTGAESGVEGEKELPDLPPLWYETAYLPRSSRGSEEDLLLKTDGAVEQAREKNTVDPEGEVQESVGRALTTNGIGSEVRLPTSSVDPIINHSNPGTSTRKTGAEEQSPTSPLTNGIHYKTTSSDQDKRSSLFVNRSPSPDPPYNESTPPHEVLSSYRSSTASTSNDSPSPPQSHTSSSKRIHSLLRTFLSPSELSLFNTIGPHVTPGNPYANGFRVPRPLQARLVSKCHTLIHHLQDRNTYFEHTVVPSISESLEGKAYDIDVMNLDAKEFSKQILELRRAIDFANKIITSTYEREFEMYRTLASIRQQRRFKGLMGMLRKWRGEKRDSRLDEDAVNKLLTRRELDAMMLMAEQNVRILREDADEMSVRVDGIKRRFARCQLVREVEQGSWRDI